MRFATRLPLLSSTLLAATVGFSTPVLANNVQNVTVDRLIVKFKTQTANPAMASAMSVSNSLKTLQQRSDVALSFLRTLRNGSVVVKLGRHKNLEETRQLMQALALDSRVDYVEPDLRMVAKAVPNDPLFPQQWHYFDATASVNLSAAWDVTQGAGTVVAVLDTGIRPHADLSANILPGYDFISDSFMGNDGNGRDSDPTDTGDWMDVGECGGGEPMNAVDSSWHGTHVAGTIAARANNNIGGTGVAPQAKILPLRVLGKCGGYLSDIADAMVWAVGGTVSGAPGNPYPAKVLNMSLGSPVPATCTRTYTDAIATARAAGALVVVAAGNEGSNANSYPPGNCAGVLTVAAVDRDGDRAYYSNAGSVVDVAAPGGAQFAANDPNGILSTANAGKKAPGADNYLFYQGTSMATPHVAGVAALVFAADPTATADEVETAIKSSTRPFVGNCSGCGAGMVDASQAVAYVTGGYTPPPRANLKLELVGDNGKFVPNPEDKTQGTIRYIAKVTNKGPEQPASVVLNNTLPADVQLLSVSASQGSCNSNATVCNLGSLAVDAQATVTIQVATLVKTKMDFSASVSSEMMDINPQDNTLLKEFGGSLGWLVLALGGLLSRRLARQPLRKG